MRPPSIDGTFLTVIRHWWYYTPSGSIGTPLRGFLSVCLSLSGWSGTTEDVKVGSVVCGLTTSVGPIGRINSKV